jgi:hypothetical protein
VQELESVLLLVLLLLQLAPFLLVLRPSRVKKFQSPQQEQTPKQQNAYCILLELNRNGFSRENEDRNR